MGANQPQYIETISPHSIMVRELRRWLCTLAGDLPGKRPMTEPNLGGVRNCAFAALINGHASIISHSWEKAI